MNRYRVRAAVVDRGASADVLTTVDTVVVLLGYNKAYAKYAAYDMITEAGETIVALSEPEFIEEI